MYSADDYIAWIKARSYRCWPTACEFERMEAGTLSAARRAAERTDLNAPLDRTDRIRCRMCHDYCCQRVWVPCCQRSVAYSSPLFCLRVFRVEMQEIEQGGGVGEGAL